MATGDKDMSDKPLIKVTVVDLGQLARPATALIEKVSDAVGGIFKPHQIVRVAKAEAEAERIRAESQILITDIHRRAMRRFLGEEAKKQANIEAITQEALPLLEDQSTPEKMEDDWITNFFDKCRIVSDADMQRLWAKVLAGEANQPGHFSRKTINLIADLNKSDADLFTQLCRFGWMIGNVVPIVLNLENSIYTLHEINFLSLSHLQTLGVVLFNGLQGFVKNGLPDRFQVFYFGRPVELAVPSGMPFELGEVVLTKAGQELAPFCGATPIEGFYEIMVAHWKAHGRILPSATETGAEAKPKQAGGENGERGAAP
jgi:hypothetical protein